MPKRSKSSKRWLREHESDPHVREAREQGYRSRAVFKLQELDERYRLFSRGMCVLELGAAPGGWSQYVAERVLPGGRVIACDLLRMDPLEGVDFVQGDFCDQAVLDRLHELIGEAGIDLVISDMAPNMSGLGAVDQPRSMYLAELALETAEQLLGPQGGFLCKLFQGQGADQFVRQLKAGFQRVAVRKPGASRARSREVYALAWNRKL